MFFTNNRMNQWVALFVVAVAGLGCPSGTVPDVRGMSVPDATTALTRAGLSLGDVIEQYDAFFSAGQVVTQAPEAGNSVTAGTNASVNLVVSRGHAPVTVPNLVGLTRDEAKQALLSVGLTVGPSTQAPHESVANGLVASQNPAAGADAAPGSSVAFVISNGPNTVVVPELSGQLPADAEAALITAGLILGTTTEQYSSQQPAGVVCGQQPPFGAQVVPGSTVDLVVSKGAAPCLVPLVISMTSAQAQTALQFAGLALGAVTESWSDVMPLGRIISQNPAAGASIPADAPVDLIVSKGPEPIVVPDLTTMSQADAETALQAVGLVLGTVTEVFSLNAPTGSVLSQEPNAGMLVYEDEPVNVVLALDKRPIRTIEELQQVGNDPNYPIDGDYVLVNDIDGTPANSWNGDTGFQPIGQTVAFTGTLDGRGHSISGLSFKETGGCLFQKIGEAGVVHHVNLIAYSSSSLKKATSFAYSNYGTIHDCTVQGDLNGGEYVGGIVNLNSGVVSRCRFTGFAKTDGYAAGGIVCGNAGVIESCEFVGTIQGSDFVGGITGENGGPISSCTAKGTITGQTYVGGIAGNNGFPQYDYPASLADCRSDCLINSSGRHVGGIVGSNWEVLSQCSAAGRIECPGGLEVGGIAGYNMSGISDSLSMAEIWTSGSVAGGLIGINDGTVQNCFATGSVKARDVSGGLIGSNMGTVTDCYAMGRVEVRDGDTVGGLIAQGEGTAVDCYWVPELSGQTGSGPGAITVDQLLSAETFSNWDYDNTWAQRDHMSVPYLKWAEQPGVLYDLEVEAHNGTVSTTPPAGHYPLWTFVRATPVSGIYPFSGWVDETRLDGNLNPQDPFYVVMHGDTLITGAFLPPVLQISSLEKLQSIGQDPLYPLNWSYELTCDLDVSATEDWNGGKGFNPIGSRLYPFTGTFDGQCHVIHNLFVNRPDERFGGLFGVMGLGSCLRDLRIEQGFSNANEAAGMLVGWNCGGDIVNCHTSGTVLANQAGGLAGDSWYDEQEEGPDSLYKGSIENCSSSCAVLPAETQPEDTYLGGLVGCNRARISRSWASGTVTVPDEDGAFFQVYSGGFIGLLGGGLISDCYATGNVQGHYSGGFVGRGDTSLVSRCYSAGLVTGSEIYEPFLGEKHGNMTTTACFVNTEVTVWPYETVLATGKTTAEMMTAATFTTAGWDFTNVWDIHECLSYPFLRAQTGCDSE